MKIHPHPVLFRVIALTGLSLVAGCFSACVNVKTEPIEIKPIYIEITINHRVQKELDDLFADIDQASETADYTPVEAPEPQKGN